VGSGVDNHNVEVAFLDSRNLFAAVVQTEHSACNTDSLTSATAAATEGFGH
jgi:hypothetical protein